MRCIVNKKERHGNRFQPQSQQALGQCNALLRICNTHSTYTKTVAYTNSEHIKSGDSFSYLAHLVFILHKVPINRFGMEFFLRIVSNQIWHFARAKNNSNDVQLLSVRPNENESIRLKWCKILATAHNWNCFELYGNCWLSVAKVCFCFLTESRYSVCICSVVYCNLDKIATKHRIRNIISIEFSHSCIDNGAF